MTLRHLFLGILVGAPMLVIACGSDDSNGSGDDGAGGDSSLFGGSGGSPVHTEPVTGGTNNGGKGGASDSNTFGGGGKTGGDQGDDQGGDTGAGGGASGDCASAGSAQACAQCVQQSDPTGNAASNNAFVTACGCTTGAACASQCADSCPAMNGEASQGCADCLNGLDQTAACLNDAETACQQDPDCANLIDETQKTCGGGASGTKVPGCDASNQQSCIQCVAKADADGANKSDSILINDCGCVAASPCADKCTNTCTNLMVDQDCATCINGLGQTAACVKQFATDCQKDADCTKYQLDASATCQ